MGQLRGQLLDQRRPEAAVVRRLATHHERPHQHPRPRRGDGPPLVDPARRIEASDEAVAAARHRLDEARLERVVAERHAQPPDGGVDAVLEVDGRAVGPQPALDVLPCDHAAGVLHEQGQDLERLLLQADRLAVATDLVPAHVDLDPADANDRRGQRRARHRAGRVRAPPEISERRHSRCCKGRGRARPRRWIGCNPWPARRRPRCGSAGSRWLERAVNRRSGRGCSPARCRSSQGMLPAPMMAGSSTICVARAQTRLLSKEPCHVARLRPASSGFGLRKCVVTCCSKPSTVTNSVACGPTKRQARPGAGRDADVVLRAEGVGAQVGRGALRNERWRERGIGRCRRGGRGAPERHDTQKRPPIREACDTPDHSTASAGGVSGQGAANAAFSIGTTCPVM